MSNDRKKSKFIAVDDIPESGFLDFVDTGSNRRISKENFISKLGVTGTLVQAGNVLGTPILNTAGTVNSIPLPQRLVLAAEFLSTAEKRDFTLTALFL